MLTLKHFLFILLSVCAIALPIGILTIADDTPSPIHIETSYGQQITITDTAQAHREWNSHENTLDNAKDRMTKRKEERDVIDKGISGDKSGLEDLLLPVVIAGTIGKRPDIAASLLLAKEVLKMLEGGKTYELHLMLIDKYAEIQSLNYEIDSLFSDRNKFHEALAHFEGFTRPYQVKDSLDEMKEYIPPLGAECGGNCGDWYYDYNHYEYYSGYRRNGVKGTPTELAMITTYAALHKDYCNGCSDEYWT